MRLFNLLHAESNVSIIVSSMPEPKVKDEIRILLVDDHPVLLEGLATMIGSEADMACVGEATTGGEAIRCFESLRPDITLLDLRLPDMSGIQVIRSIRATDPDARIIVLTTYQGDVQAVQALQAGAMGYLLKATLRKVLLATVRAVHAGEHWILPEVESEIAAHAGAPALTPREIEVLKQVAAGCSNKIVADRLHISDDTVKGHIRKILVKLKASDRTHAVAIAVRRGFFEL
jgi:DNA-binding NarL/FixJ family response regulator